MSTDRRVSSRFLSLVLRHQPDVAGITLDEQGWVSIEALLVGIAGRGQALSREGLLELVANNDKKRFEISGDGLRIRASQGHSVAVELGYEPAVPPDVLYHGTATKFLTGIEREGLRKRSRHHVHLSATRATAEQVGGRHGTPVVLVVDARAMHASNHAFFVSTNGVWLTDHVPPEFVRRDPGT